MEEIALRTQFSTAVNRDEVRKVLDSALRNETDLAEARRTTLNVLAVLLNSSIR